MLKDRTHLLRKTYITARDTPKKKKKKKKKKKRFGPLQLALRPLEEIICTASIDDDSVSLGLEL
jgi:hypothetical protein